MTHDLRAERIARVVEGLPERVTRQALAARVSETLFMLSHKTVEKWGLPVLIVNGRATLNRDDAAAHAVDLLEAAEA